MVAIAAMIESTATCGSERSSVRVLEVFVRSEVVMVASLDRRLLVIVVSVAKVMMNARDVEGPRPWSCCSSALLRARLVGVRKGLARFLGICYVAKIGGILGTKLAGSRSLKVVITVPLLLMIPCLDSVRASQMICSPYSHSSFSRSVSRAS